MSAAIPVAVQQNTPAWLDARRDVVGSSDIPVITGNGIYATSVLSLWAIKTRLLEPETPDEDTQELFDLGHLMEPVIAARYTLKTGREVDRVNRLLLHPTLPHTGASLDRRARAKGARRIVELKWAPHRRWADGPEPVPAGVQDQVQWQLMVTGYDVADVAVLNGSKVEVHEVEPDRVYQENLVFLAQDFWGYVDRGEIPPIDGSEVTRRTLGRMYPVDPNAMALPSWPAMETLAGEWRAAKDAVKAAEDIEGTIGNSIRALLGTAPGVDGRDYRITYAQNKDGKAVEWPAVALEMASLLDEENPEAVLARYAAAHTKVKPGARPCRLWTKGESGKWS